MFKCLNFNEDFDCNVAFCGKIMPIFRTDS